jgi:hypothetical protein
LNGNATGCPGTGGQGSQNQLEVDIIRKMGSDLGLLVVNTSGHIYKLQQLFSCNNQLKTFLDFRYSIIMQLV